MAKAEQKRNYVKYVNARLQGFEACGCLLPGFVTTGSDQAALRQGIKPRRSSATKTVVRSPEPLQLR